MDANTLKRLTLKLFKEALRAGEQPGRVVLAKSHLGTTFKAVEGEERVREFIASDASIDRDGDTIAVDGWELDNFRKGGAFLWAHNSQLPPVGAPVKVYSAGESLVLRVRFPEPDMPHPMGMGFGDTVMRMYDAGLMRGVSVGFLPKEWTFNEERAGWAPMDFKRQELLEVSAVPVPANPNALLIAAAKGIDTKSIVNWYEECLGSDALALPRDEIKAALDTVAKASVMVKKPEDEPAKEDEVKQPTPEELIERAVKAEAGQIHQALTVLKSIAKRGRTLSVDNESLLRKVQDLVSQVIDPAENDPADEGIKGAAATDDDDDDDDGGESGSGGEQLISASEFRALLRERMAEAVHQLTGKLPD